MVRPSDRWSVRDRDSDPYQYKRNPDMKMSEGLLERAVQFLRNAIVMFALAFITAIVGL